MNAQQSRHQRQWAQDAAALGLRVFPVKSNQKTPDIAAWPKAASCDASTVEKWFRDGERNIGIYAGERMVDGAPRPMVVLDLDVKKGKDGVAELARLCEQHGALPETLTVGSPSGGKHIYLYVPSQVATGVDVLAPGIDVRARGGYVLAPGSRIDNKEYTVLVNEEIADCPDWLFAMLKPARTRSSNRAPLKGIDPERAEKRAIEYLTALKEVTEGGRNDAAFKAAAKVKNLGCDQSACVPLMLEHWPCVPMLDTDELQTVVASAYRGSQDPQGSDAAEAAFEPVAEVDPITEAHTWDRDRITANARKLYDLRLRDRQRFDGLRQAWAMFDTIADDELQDILGNAALLSAGIPAATVLLADHGQLQRIDVQRAMASLSRKDNEAFGWLEARLVGGGIGKRAVNAACKAGRDAIAERTVSAVRRKDGRALVVYNPSNVAQTVDNLEAALLADSVHARVFKHSGAYVSVWEAAPVTVRELAGGGDYPPMAVLHRYDAHSMAERLNRSVRLEMPPPEDGAPKAIAPPEAAVRMLLSRRGGVAPVITGIIEAPTVRNDGTVLDAEGYDAQTGLFAIFGGRQFAVPPDAPTQADAATSLRFLQDELFAEFPFAEPVDRTAAVAALITGLVRPVLAGSAPGFLLASPTQGTGKTALAQAICHGAFGRPAPAQSWPSSDEEMSKYLLGALREGQRAVVFDNLRDGTLVDNAELAAAMTSDTYSRRGLGGHDTVTVPTAVLWIITGNNVRPAGDMPSRLVEVYLDANVARPDQRHFARDLVSWVASRRPQIVAAAIAIVRAYLVAGCPRIDAKATRFDKWDRMVRLPLIYAGGADVGTKFDKAYANDPGLEAWAAVLAQWHAAFGDESLTTSDLLDRLNRPEFDGPINALNTALRDVVSDGRNRELLSSKSLGGRLAQFVNRPLGALCLRDGQNRKNVKEWRVCQALPNPT
jgi:hypothetical protein